MTLKIKIAHYWVDKYTDMRSSIIGVCKKKLNKIKKQLAAGSTIKEHNSQAYRQKIN